MLPLMLLLLAGEPPKVALVGGWDDRPTATVAMGFGRQLAPVRRAAETCGFSRTWVWDDDSSGAELWVLASEVRPRRVGCLRRWKVRAGAIGVRWLLVGTR